MGKRLEYVIVIALLLGVTAAILMMPKPQPLPPPQAFAQLPQERGTLPSEQFLSIVNQRLATSDLSCDGFSDMQEQACRIYQTAFAMYGLPCKGAYASNKKGCFIDRSGPATAPYSKDKFALVYAMSAMNRVPIIISTSRYRLARALMEKNKFDPGSDPEAIAKARYGICGHHAAFFIALLESVGIKARAAQIYYHDHGIRNSHIAAEAFIGGKWRYFDSTFSGVFLSDPNDPFSVVSLEEVLKDGNAVRVANDSLPWVYWSGTGFDNFAYTKLHPSVVYNYEQGEIFLSDIDVEKGVIPLNDIPNYLGDPADNGPFLGVTYAFPPISGKRTFTFDIAAISGCDAKARLCVNDACASLADTGQDTIRITTAGAERMRVESPMTPVCYVTLNAIRFSPAQ